MKVYQCDQCEYASVSNKYRCPRCGTGQLQEQDVSSKGSVYSYTDIHIAPAEFAHLAPYTVALIQLDESKAKVTARTDGTVEIGDVAELDYVEDGAYIYRKC
ncbi:nucleic acid-binding protein [Sporosarcina sp. P21c]|uniref:Zn-ribbon domain-containing OB-fold protein n=1 Tax=unclassified Sporosarcina TaxID=2647733 RepID=UPI000C16AADC|nr:MULTISPECIES: OB-fold domain-containing protein [unclassified Sporosarcina]PIC68256.1 nucleic acid-binding protein [Sporosarcina sp. P16a]PIC90466.1 nucleic acid-binding protein [Sporosarcina sp. P21c]PIC93997.1 nucleic acid-binding protein [Sporosarcina sp. P25]